MLSEPANHAASRAAVGQQTDRPFAATNSLQMTRFSRVHMKQERTSV
jgi:hypothetical protein